jgi:hypothetical protein
VFSRTLGAASPPRVHFPLAWLFLYGLAPFHTYHRHDRDRLRNRLVPLRCSVVVLVCILVALFRNFTSSTWIARNSDRDGEEEEVERKAEGIFFGFVFDLFFLYFLVCFFVFFLVFFFFWCGKRALAWARDGGESRVSVFTHSRLHVMSHWNQNSNFSLFLCYEFFSSRGWRFCDFFCREGGKMRDEEGEDIFLARTSRSSVINETFRDFFLQQWTLDVDRELGFGFLKPAEDQFSFKIWIRKRSCRIWSFTAQTKV